MVLQRNVETNVWGWANPGERVRVTFAEVKRETVADSEGSWAVTLPAMAAGGPLQMHIQGDNSLKLEDILIGDVWLASGQSNMELTLARAEPRFAELVPDISNTKIRQFEVLDRYDFKAPQADLAEGQWLPATQEHIRSFSAVAYFFAEQIHRSEQVPIGIINASLGGSPVEAWMSESALKRFPTPYEEAKRFRDDQLIGSITQEDKARSDAWFEALHQKDEGYKNGKYLWAAPDVDTAKWQSTKIPSLWQDNEVSESAGVVWYRKTVEIPAELAKQNALLIFGTIVDADQIFVNGTKIGETTYMYPPRRYVVPAGVLRPGENIITVRVTSQQGKGGFVRDKEYALVFAHERIDLEGRWRYKRGATVERLASQTFIRWKPLGLYNAMIAPLLNYKIKGVIWYQGESNAGEAQAYAERFPAMIKDWRKQWQHEDLPFLFVQLANYVPPGAQRGRVGNWPELRQAQTQTLALPNTAMVVSIDVGEWNDIHPLDKKTIGDRLAAAAKHVAYSEDIVYSGPLLRTATAKGGKVQLTFAHVGGGLKAEDGPLQSFEVAGSNGKFYPAKARIRGNKVVVKSSKVASPRAVRYGWSDNPEKANLFNKEGFPASPFKTEIANK